MLSGTWKPLDNSSERIGDAVLDSCIKGLPLKQQVAVKAHFKVAARKMTSGMIYEKECVSECMLLSMKRPKLYEHLHKHNILVLPSRTHLQHYVHKFETSSKVLCSAPPGTVPISVPYERAFLFFRQRHPDSVERLTMNGKTPWDPALTQSQKGMLFLCQNKLKFFSVPAHQLVTDCVAITVSIRQAMLNRSIARGPLSHRRMYVP